MDRVFDILKDDGGAKSRLDLGGSMRLAGPYDKLTLKLQKLTGCLYYRFSKIGDTGTTYFRSVHYLETR